mgnify:CR=1 FL=1
MEQLQISKSMAIFHELWRMAYKNADFPPIQCGSIAAAQRLRFALYNAVKPYRAGKREADPELKEAMINCSIALTPDRCGVIVQRKLDSEMSQILLKAIGGEIPLTIDERMAQSAYERIMKRGQADPSDSDFLKGREHDEVRDEVNARRYGARL